MKILITNVGSTSLKYSLYEMPEERLLGRGRIERVGGERSTCTTWSGNKERTEEVRLPDFTAAIDYVKTVLTTPPGGLVKSLSEIDAVGFKVVHAKGYSGCQILNQDVLDAMKDYYLIAPVHNPPYVRAIEQFRQSLPDTPLIGLFETAFHQTMPDYADTYGVPLEWKKQFGIRRCGFHGASHAYLAARLPELLSRPSESLNLVTCHLGGSSSITAVQGGRSVENSFGFSTQSGIAASTRVGDLDPYIIPYIMKAGGYSIEAVCSIFAEKSGLQGIAGMDPDMRDLEKAANEGNARARLAMDTFIYSIKKYIGAYTAILGRVDALVFAGGIGERSIRVRSQVCHGLEVLGMHLDESRNRACSGPESCISQDGSPVAIWVVPTNEEIIVARAVAEKIKEIAE